MSKHAFTVIVAVVIALSLLMYLFMYQVRSDEVAVVVTFGKASETLPEPGLHARWPWPIQQINKFDNRLNIHEGPEEETYTGDRLNIITSFCVGWKITDALVFNENFGREKEPTDAAWGKILAHVRDSVSAILGQHPLHDLVSVRTQELKYDSVEEEMRKRAADSLKIYGIDVVLLKIKRIQFPGSVTMSVYKRMKAERNKEATTILEDGREKAANIKADAESKRDQILDTAKAEAERIRGEGEAEAAKHYESFAKNPELHKYLLQIDTLKKATEASTTLILDPSVPPFNILVDEPPETE